MEAICPGNLSWWGINVEKWYKTNPQQKDLKQKLEKMEKYEDGEKMYVSLYLQPNPSSHYGNVSFTGSLDTLLKNYIKSRNLDKGDSGDEEVCHDEDTGGDEWDVIRVEVRRLVVELMHTFERLAHYAIGTKSVTWSSFAYR